MLLLAWSFGLVSWRIWLGRDNLATRVNLAGAQAVEFAGLCVALDLPRPLPSLSRFPWLIWIPWLAIGFQFVREGLCQILTPNGAEIIHEAGSISAALDLITENPYSAVLLDMSLPDGNGIDALKLIRARWPRLPVLVLSMHQEDLWALRVVAAGAIGYLNKSTSSTEIIKAVKQVIAGGTYLSAHLSQRPLEIGRFPLNDKNQFASLSNREFEVFRLLGSGKSEGEVARILRPILQNRQHASRTHSPETGSFEQHGDHGFRGWRHNHLRTGYRPSGHPPGQNGFCQFLALDARGSRVSSLSVARSGDSIIVTLPGTTLWYEIALGTASLPISLVTIAPNNTPRVSMRATHRSWLAIWSVPDATGELQAEFDIRDAFGRSLSHEALMVGPSGTREFGRSTAHGTAFARVRLWRNGSIMVDAMFRLAGES